MTSSKRLLTEISIYAKVAWRPLIANTAAVCGLVQRVKIEWFPENTQVLLISCIFGGKANDVAIIIKAFNIYKYNNLKLDLDPRIRLATADVENNIYTLIASASVNKRFVYNTL